MPIRLAGSRKRTIGCAALSPGPHTVRRRSARATVVISRTAARKPADEERPRRARAFGDRPMRRVDRSDPKDTGAREVTTPLDEWSSRRRWSRARGYDRCVSDRSPGGATHVAPLTSQANRPVVTPRHRLPTAGERLPHARRSWPRPTARRSLPEVAVADHSGGVRPPRESAVDDLALFAAVLRGEHTLQGFRNRHARAELFGPSAATDHGAAHRSPAS